MTAVVADFVLQELSEYLHQRNMTVEAEKLWNVRKSLVQLLTVRANSTYEANTDFRRRIRARGDKGRDTLCMYMRHWLAAQLKVLFPSIYEMLPAAYSVGQTLS